jgi:hypothetical protein
MMMRRVRGMRSDRVDEDEAGRETSMGMMELEDMK